MSLAGKTLAELAKLNAGVGPVDEAQPGGVNSEAASPIDAGDYAAIDGEDLAEGDGVDVSNATFAALEIMPTGGDVVFTVFIRRTGADEFAAMNGLVSITTAIRWTEFIFVGPGDEVAVLPEGGSSSSVAIVIAPCNG